MYKLFNKDMDWPYSTAKVPDFKDKSKMLSLDPELSMILAKSRDHEELEYYWTQWREVSG